MRRERAGSLVEVRAAATAAVAATSLRAVAAEIGMSFSGLRSFLDGGTPFEATQVKLRTWFLGRAASEAIAASVAATDAAAAAALAVLLAHLAPSRQTRAARAIAEVVADLTSPDPVPTWAVRLARLKRRGSDADARERRP